MSVTNYDHCGIIVDHAEGYAQIILVFHSLVRWSSHVSTRLRGLRKRFEASAMAELGQIKLGPMQPTNSFSGCGLDNRGQTRFRPNSQVLSLLGDAA